MNNKFGYGRWDASYWFVGPEEGGGGDCVELATRIEKWHLTAQGVENGLRDLPVYCTAIDHPEFHRRQPKKQPTWCNVLKLLGTANGGPPEWIDRVPVPSDWPPNIRPWEKRLQRDQAGRARIIVEAHDIAFLDLSPLPSPNMNLWLWRCLTGSVDVMNNARFATREAFLASSVPPNITFAQHRMNQLTERVSQHKPKLLVFYGIDIEQWAFAPHFGLLAERNMGRPIAGVRRWAIDGCPTTILSLNHPRSFRGERSWNRVAQEVCDFMAQERIGPFLR